MNERIRELKKQAWEYTMAVHDGHIVPPLDKEVWPIDKVLDEKFAELIVRECVKVCADRGKHHDGLYSAWASDCSERIGKHFGVEE